LGGRVARGFAPVSLRIKYSISPPPRGSDLRLFVKRSSGGDREGDKIEYGVPTWCFRCRPAVAGCRLFPGPGRVPPRRAAAHGPTVRAVSAVCGLAARRLRRSPVRRASTHCPPVVSLIFFIFFSARVIIPCFGFFVVFLKKNRSLMARPAVFQWRCLCL